jgi:hypothetical protein
MKLKFFCSFSLAILLIFVLQSNRANAVNHLLYDPIKQPVTLDRYVPQWLIYADTGGEQAWHKSPPGTLLDTLADLAIVDGYSNYGGLHLANKDFPNLSRSNGYSLTFTVEILKEEHNRAERAGFSVIILSQDVNNKTHTSLEIGFQKNRIFLQNDQPLFGRQAAQENLKFNPVDTGAIEYQIKVKDNEYILSSGKNLILKGKLRDYTRFTGLLNPYRFPSFIFLGDDTTSASAKINLGKIVLQVNSHT